MLYDPRRSVIEYFGAITSNAHVYDVRLRKDKRGVDLISDALPFGRLWYDEPDAIGYAKFRSRLHDAVIRVYDDADARARWRFQRVLVLEQFY